MAKKVLFESEKVQLTTVQKISKEKPAIKERTSRTATNSLFETLRKLRSEIAKEEGVPAYIIFNDATLKQLEAEQPMSDAEFLNIDGVGKAKLEKYGDAFIKAIIEFQKNKTIKPKKEGSTYKVTLEMYQSGMSVEKIAAKRELGASTITSHLAKLYIDGHPIDLSSYITTEEISKIAEAKIKLESPNALKPYFDFFEEQIRYDKIRIGLAMIEKSNLNTKNNEKAYSVNEIRLQHSEAYKKWSVEDDIELERLFNEGKKEKELAVILGRNQGAINSRLKKVGLK